MFFRLSICLHKFVRLVTRESTIFDNKLGYGLKSPQKIIIFQRYTLSNTFCHFPNVKTRLNAFREVAIADRKVEEYKN